MAGSFRNELDAFMRARTEQIPAWHEMMTDTKEERSVEEALAILSASQRIHRDALLRIAEEIDGLRRAVEPEA